MNGYEASMMSYQAGYDRADRGERAVKAALQLYQGAQTRAWLGRVWATLTGQPRRLFHLRDIHVSQSRHAGTRAVPIRQILGSEDRCDDFDADFRPLQAHSKSRWMRIATAMQLGEAMPPVELTQVGDVYFCRDGHHRISVARAMGQEHIDAEVTVWEVTGPLPWGQQSLPPDRLAGQPV